LEKSGAASRVSAIALVAAHIKNASSIRDDIEFTPQNRHVSRRLTAFMFNPFLKTSFMN
jgi:hypothetical protein